MSAVCSLLIPLYLALLLDLTLGDPPNRFHPVAWMGSFIAAMRRVAERATNDADELQSVSHMRSLAWGTGLVVVGLALTISTGWAIQTGLAHLPDILNWMIQAVVLKTTFSIRGLAHAAERVARALGAGDLVAARGWLEQHLVSRDTSQLDEAAIAAAAVESVAENSSDSVIAPIFYFALAGLPGALAYRFVNTADAMIGYRDPRYFWLGKPAARLDDLLNLLPARLTTVLMLLASPLVGGSALRGVKVWWRDARLTASPNAGQPMSMAAGLLGVELEKAGHYRLGAGLATATVTDISRVVRLLYATVGLLVVIVTITAWFWQS